MHPALFVFCLFTQPIGGVEESKVVYTHGAKPGCITDVHVYKHHMFCFK